MARLGRRPTPWYKRVRFEGECWLWQGHTTRKGYGAIRIDNKIKTVHRIAYEDLVGPIPAGLTLDHLCNNPACVRPSHLDPCTASENSKRAHVRRKNGREVGA